MNTILKKLPFVVCIMVTSFLTSNLHANQSYNLQEVVTKIILNESHCVHAYEENKIYLKHENIYPMEDGLFLDLNGIESILLNNLKSDSRGCWVPNICASDYPIAQKCSGCGQGYYIKCTNPSCPLNKK